MTTAIHSRGLPSAPKTAVFVSLVIICILLGVAQPLQAAETTAGTQSVEVPVYWDFGSGPGKISNFYIGKRVMQAQYETPDCASRFTLESASYEIAREFPGSAPVVRLLFAKHFEGDFELLPQVTIVQPGTTGTTSAAIVFPFRERNKAVLVGADLPQGFIYTSRKPEWSHADIDIQIEAPAASLELRKPYEWSTIPRWTGKTGH
jgi:hypothetical protein